MAFTTPNSAIRTMGDPPQGLEHVSGPVGRVMADIGDALASRHAEVALAAASDESLRVVIARLLDPKSATRRELVFALSQALGGSIRNLGYPVGMGEAPNASHLLGAAAKIVDRTALCIVAEAAEQTPQDAA